VNEGARSKETGTDSVRKSPQAGAGLAVKIVLDRIFAAVGLILISPLLAVIAIAIVLSLGSPVLFRQRRPGQKAKPITLVKFRTMKETRGPDGELLPDADRLTPFGKFLRSTSLDEIPQLWNVLRGDLSFVGPRPLLMQYLERYTPAQSRRHDVLPGITGWAQVKGRNALTWDEKFAFDIWYVDNWSLTLDFRIIWLTLLRLPDRRGISRKGHATMPEFTGNVRDHDDTGDRIDEH